jgi:hypothetical protein
MGRGAVCRFLGSTQSVATFTATQQVPDVQRLLCRAAVTTASPSGRALVPATRTSPRPVRVPGETMRTTPAPRSISGTAIHRSKRFITHQFAPANIPPTFMVVSA